MDVYFDNIKLRNSYKNCEGKISLSIFESKSRSWVPFFVYLPPNWDYSKEYPLILFMHGMGGDETTFKKYVQAQQLNNWILKGEIEPIVIAGVRGDNNRDKVQWHTKENQDLLLGDSYGEFISFCQHKFNAGVAYNSISLEGHSRGAGGAIYYYLKKPGMFVSVVAMGYVSDYTLQDNCLLAKNNLTDLRKEAKALRLEIGTEDSFVRTKNRKCIFDLHEYLNELKLDHEFEVLHGVEHGFDTFWNYCTDHGILNGLSHLKFHEKARKKFK